MIPAIQSNVSHHVIERKGMLHIIELLQEFNALIPGKVTVSLWIGQAEALGEIADDGNDI